MEAKMMPVRVCSLCGKQEDNSDLLGHLLPVGDNNALICHDCGIAPENIHVVIPRLQMLLVATLSPTTSIN